MLDLSFLSYANSRTVLVGTVLLGLCAGVIGVMMMLRRKSLLGDAVAHAALPGVCVAYLIIGDRNFIAFLFGALVFGICASGLIAFVRAHVRVKDDAITAIVIGGFFGIGIALSRWIQNLPGGNRAGLDTFLFGKAAAMVKADVELIVYVCLLVLALVVIFYKELAVSTFDREFAAVQGWPVKAIDFFLSVLVCAVTVVALPAIGVVLVVALLVIPAATARFWTNSLATLLIMAGCIGAFSGALGSVLSATLEAPSQTLSRGWPTGPMITLVAFSCFVISLLFAPRRGMISHYFRLRRFRKDLQSARLN
ncbi:metal ABC transporter permease [bacterium]|nr:metal ABC transporter permease [bacterium]